MAKIPAFVKGQISNAIFPDMERTPPAEKKTPRYSLQIMNTILKQYVNNQGGMPYYGTNISADNYIDNLRTIARGRQSPDQYKRYFAGGELPTLNVSSDTDIQFQRSNAEASRKGWFTGMWESFNPIVNMKTMAKGWFLPQETDIKAFCIDADASIREIEKMNSEWVNYKFKPMFNYLRASIGLPPDNSGMADSYQKIVELKNQGTFKDRFIIAFEEIIKHTEEISKWSTALKEKLFDDIFDIGVAFALADFDPAQKKVIWKYLDPKDVGVQFTLQSNFDDCQVFYWFEYWNMNKVRLMMDKFRNGDDIGMTQQDLETIANKYKDYQDNINSLWYSEKKPTEFNMSDIKVCVMRGRWFDAENTKTSEYIKNGQPRSVKYSEKHETDKNYLVTNNRELKRYDATLLVGTDFVCGYGPARNQSFKNKNTPSLDFAGFKLMEKSYIERLVPIAHLFAIHFIKFTNSLAKAVDDYVEIDKGLLAQFTNGPDEKSDPLLGLRMLKQELVYITDSTNVAPENLNREAIQTRKGTLTSAIIHLDMMERYMRLAELQTGISPQTIGATPDAKLPVRTALMSKNSTEVSLSVLANAVMVIKRNLAEKTIPMVTNLIDADKVIADNYSKVIGEDDVENILESKGEIDNMGLSLYPRPKEEMKDRLLRYAELSAQKGDLDPIDLWELDYQMSRGGNALELTNKYRAQIEKEKQRKQENQIQLQREIGQQNQQAQQIASKNQQDIQQQRAIQDTSRTNNKARLDAINSNIDFANEMQKLIIQDAQENGVDPSKLLAGLENLKNQNMQQMQQTT